MNRGVEGGVETDSKLDWREEELRLPSVVDDDERREPKELNVGREKTGGLPSDEPGGGFIASSRALWTKAICLSSMIIR